jgi:hypothetical protein
VLEPDGDQLKITLKGDVAGMLNAARPPSHARLSRSRASASFAGAFGGGEDSKRSPDTGDLLVQIKLVAGARNRQYRPRCTSSRHEHLDTEFFGV